MTEGETKTPDLGVQIAISEGKGRFESCLMP